MSELNHELEELYKEAEEKAAVLKKDLKEKFGIAAEDLKTKEYEEVELNLEQEFAKLKRIKELLTSHDAELKELVEEEKEEEEKEEAGALEKEAETEEKPYFEKPEEREELEPPVSEEHEAKEEEALAEEGEEAELKGETAEVSEALEEYRISETTEDNREISYFQKNDKIILDGEYLISALSYSLIEAKKLCIKLTQTELPKDQFFIKREIIEHQEVLRKVILKNVRMCEKESCSLSAYTIDILNMDILKDIFEKLSMENWSIQDDFTCFEKFAKNLKDNYYARITPPALYLKSIIDELKIE